jgi:hypothetical protein
MYKSRETGLLAAMIRSMQDELFMILQRNQLHPKCVNCGRNLLVLEIVKICFSCGYLQ